MVVSLRMQSIDGYVLEKEHYRPSGRIHGEVSAALPSFADLALAPDAIWP
jgi:hypothetical protein